MEEINKTNESIENKSNAKPKRKTPYKRNYNKKENTKKENSNIAKVEKKEEIVKFKKSPIKIIPLGGLLEIGKNITVFEYENDIVIVDCGIAFPEDDMLGVDLVIPDVTYLEKNKEKIRGMVITHGHEDHIGAIPYFLKQINVPIYATKLTTRITRKSIKNKKI